MVQWRSPLYSASCKLHLTARQAFCEPRYRFEQYRTITLHMNTYQLQQADWDILVIIAASR
jgi:hypothetical protein